MIRPAAISTSPHGPISSTISTAIDGLRISASSLRGTTPSDSNVTIRYTASADSTASMVARPTSFLLRARAETTTAPSTPINTHRVISMVSLTCSHTGLPKAMPLKSSVNTSILKAIAARTANIPSGSSLARVAARLMLAAVCTPRNTSACTIHSRADSAISACQVLPSPRMTLPPRSVKILSAANTITRYETLAITAHSQ